MYFLIPYFLPVASGDHWLTLIDAFLQLVLGLDARIVTNKEAGSSEDEYNN
jgi:hypothetical protein